MMVISYYQDISSSIEHDSTDQFIRICDILLERPDNYSEIDLFCESRGGLFDEDQMFAVWERDDVVKLIERLLKSLKDGYFGGE